MRTLQDLIKLYFT